MAPKVKVPADFGRQHIGAPSHGNLTFKLKDGEETKANSIILSLNSPVIDHLTTNLDQQSLDVDDFHRDAVDCFIEAAYTGELEHINQANFRDVNKMSHVFDVSWLSRKCAGYFKYLVDGLDMNEYDEILYIVEEARFIRNALKKSDFLELVITKMSSMAAERNIFIERYLTDFIDFPKDKLDVVIEIAEMDVHVLVKSLTLYITEHNDCIDNNTRYLLENINLPVCYSSNTNEFDSLFSALENVKNMTQEDCKIFMKLSKMYAESYAICHASLVSSVVSSVNITNPFHSFVKYVDMNFHELVQQLTVSKEITNFYIFFDAVWFWLLQHVENDIICDSKLLNEITLIKESRCWGPIAYGYLDRIYIDDDTKNFVDMIKESNILVDREERNCLSSVKEYEIEEFVDTLSLSDNRTKLWVNNAQSGHCKQKGSCGLTLETKTEDNRMSDIQLRIKPSEYASHSQSHSDIISGTNKWHIILQYKKINQQGWRFLPLSGCGKPSCNATEKYWYWGYLQLYHVKDSQTVTNWQEDAGPMFDQVFDLSKNNDFRKFRYALFQLG